MKRVLKEYWSSKWVPKTYYIILYVKIHIWDKNNFAGVTSEPNKTLYRLDLGKTDCEYLDLVRSEFLKFVASPNESLRYIIV